MGYLDKATITVDAILTNRGRELLAEGGAGNSQLEIVKFAVADDEIDYGLYFEAQQDGNKGIVIENMPVLEATPDEQQIMRYKLLSLDDNLAGLLVEGVFTVPTITNGPVNDVIPLRPGQLSVEFTPATSPLLSTGPLDSEYIVQVADATLVDIFRGAEPTPINTSGAINANGSITFRAPRGAILRFKAKETLTGGIAKVGTTVATLFGKETGATKSITITVSRS
jgi:hypothetical protein